MTQKPTYALVFVQAAVETQCVTAFNASVINGGAALGMTTTEMIQLICLGVTSSVTKLCRQQSILRDGKMFITGLRQMERWHT